MSDEGKGKVKFSFDFGDDKKIDNGLLRFAYLYSFYCFGYSYIFSPGGEYINQYLTFNKNKGLKPLIVSEELDECEQGIYRISIHPNVKSFLVIFQFGTKVKKNIGIIIPGPTEDHLNNFNSLSQKEIGPLSFGMLTKQKINVNPFFCYKVWN